MKHSNTIGIILAGGESRRFGSHKAFAKFNKKNFYEYSFHAMCSFVDEIFIVIHPSIKEQFKQNFALHILEDIPQFKGFGPLAGILTVMRKKKAEWYFVLPCDTPGITSELVEQLLTFTNENVDAIVPVIQGQIHPLSAIYHSNLLNKIEGQLKEHKLKMKDLLDICNVKYISEKDLNLKGFEFHNINKQEELKLFQEHVNQITP